MFRRSLVGGFTPLVHWEVWVGVLGYVFLFLIYTMLIGITQRDKANAAERGAGCLLMIFGSSLVQGMLMSLLLLFVLPVLIGGERPPASDYLQAVRPALVAGLVASVITTIVTFIPIIGGYIADNPSATAFLQGIIVFRILIGPTINQVTQEHGISNRVFPGWWETLGYIVIAGLLPWLLSIVAAVVHSGAHRIVQKFNRNHYLPNLEEDVAVHLVIAPSLAILSGLMVVMMYIHYVVLMLRR